MPDHPASSQRALLLYIDSTPPLPAILAAVRERMAADAAHDMGHLFRVARWTLRLLRETQGGDAVDPRLAVAAALLHDVVNVPKSSPERAQASERSAEVARSLLPPLGIDAVGTALVADAVRDHSFSRGAVPSSLLGRALQDADRLEALGAIGVFRCIAAGVHLGAEFFDADDPWARARSLDDRRWSVDHFFTKLLALPSRFQTAAGRREAERRVQAMRALLAELGDELGDAFGETPH